MIDVNKAASYIFNRYHAETNTKIDEMKLHKLLYFTQRECIIMLGEPMFSAEFTAWRYGPVLTQIRDCYRWNMFTSELADEELAKYKPVFDSVFANYASKSSWSLSMLSHGELSWQRARADVPQDANCDVKMKLEDIEADAERIRLRRFYFNEILPEINNAT